jgi:hypothetical protein
MTTYDNSRDFGLAAQRRREALNYGEREPQWMKDAQAEKARREDLYRSLRASGLDCDAAFDAVAAEYGILSSRLTIDAYDDE